MAYLDITSDAPKSVTEWWFEVIRPMRDFFSLAMDMPIDVACGQVVSHYQRYTHGLQFILLREKH